MRNEKNSRPWKRENATVSSRGRFSRESRRDLGGRGVQEMMEDSEILLARGSFLGKISNLDWGMGIFKPRIFLKKAKNLVRLDPSIICCSKNVWGFGLDIVSSGQNIWHTHIPNSKGPDSKPISIGTVPSTFQLRYLESLALLGMKPRVFSWAPCKLEVALLEVCTMWVSPKGFNKI